MAVKHRPRQVRPVSAGAELHSKPREPLATQMGDQSLQRDEIVQSPVAQIGKRKAATRLIGRSLSGYQIAGEIGEVPARQQQRGIVGGSVRLQSIQRLGSGGVIAREGGGPRQPGQQLPMLTGIVGGRQRLAVRSYGARITGGHQHVST